MEHREGFVFDFNPSEDTWMPSLLCSPTESTVHAAGAGSWGALLTPSVEGMWEMPSPVPSSGGGSEPERPHRLLSTWRDLTRAWEAVKECSLEEGVQTGGKDFLGEGNHGHKTGLVGLVWLTTQTFFCLCVYVGDENVKNWLCQKTWVYPEEGKRLFLSKCPSTF